VPSRCNASNLPGGSQREDVVHAPWCRSGTSRRKSKHPAEEDEGRRAAHHLRKKSYVPSPPRLHFGGNTFERSLQFKACSRCQRCARGNGRARGRRGVCLAIGWEVFAFSFVSQQTRIVSLRRQGRPVRKWSRSGDTRGDLIPLLRLHHDSLRYGAHVRPAWWTHAGACVPVWRPHATTLARVVLTWQCRTGKQERVERAQSKRKTKQQLIAAHPAPRAAHRNDFL